MLIGKEFFFILGVLHQVHADLVRQLRQKSRAALDGVVDLPGRQVPHPPGEPLFPVRLKALQDALKILRQPQVAADFQGARQIRLASLGANKVAQQGQGRPPDQHIPLVPFPLLPEGHAVCGGRQQQGRQGRVQQLHLRRLARQARQGLPRLRVRRQQPIDQPLQQLQRRGGTQAHSLYPLCRATMPPDRFT